MAERKPEHREEEQPSLRELLLWIQPRLFDLMIELSGARSQADFAKKAEIHESDVSRYRQGKHLATDNLAKIAYRTCGLDGRQLLWLIGHVSKTANEAFAVELPRQADEVREPGARYSVSGLGHQVEAITGLDLRGLEASDVLALNRRRQVLAELYALSQENAGALDQLLALVYRLIVEFQEEHAAARNRARARRP